MFKIAVFSLSDGVLEITEGKEEEFFKDADADIRLTTIELNALAIAAIEAVGELEPFIIPTSTTSVQETMAGLRAGIEKAGGIPDKAVEGGRLQFRKMEFDGKIYLVRKLI